MRYLRISRVMTIPHELCKVSLEFNGTRSNGRQAASKPMASSSNVFVYFRRIIYMFYADFTKAHVTSLVTIRARSIFLAIGRNETKQTSITERQKNGLLKELKRGVFTGDADTYNVDGLEREQLLIPREKTCRP
ncbi:hypothetical protein AVEN_104342-1 [Araneus ventricosus]|uniref:Uncharacterized protein n=1 Tax=Araneus ventricosus TaxID=182803 RepID=A0A4Y2BV88_ARAVE|nr:hypothetical protein AVEN_104342-1 [Araneus ventricosus]